MSTSQPRIRLAEIVADDIRLLIKESDLEPGDRLFTIDELAVTTGVNLRALRDAIALLENARIIEVFEDRGVFLCASSDVPALSPETEEPREMSSLLLEQLEMRYLIEPECAATAAEIATAEELALVSDTVALMEAAFSTGSVQSAIVQDEAFHTRIARIAGNRISQILARTYSRKLADAWISGMWLTDRVSGVIEEHRKILNRIVERDPNGARDAMGDHLRAAIESVRFHQRQYQSRRTEDR